VPEVTIIADDLTGAADCGIAFTLAGIETFVATGGKPAPSARVLAVDTDSRALPAAEAARRTAAAAGAASVLYKKIDSTLRGNAGSEIAAIAKGAFVVAAPAFPAAGRTTIDGEVLVQGVRLGDTEIWRSSGMRGPSTLAEMLRAEGLRTAVVRLGQIRASAESALGTAAEAASAAVCDAETDDDLALIAQAAARLHRRVVWAGSSGLARQLPKALALRPGGAPQLPPRRKGPVLTLVGSRAGASRAQADALASSPRMFSLVIKPEALLARNQPGDELERALGDGRDCLVAIDVARELDLGKALELARALGEFAAPHAVRCSGLIATGGDTARALLAALDLSGIALLGEIEAGVPFGLAGSLLLVTKAGGFGTRETLLRASAALHRMTD
jgi:4-hydroxythreonine-4-phosphate dehydrogenase